MKIIFNFVWPLASVFAKIIVICTILDLSFTFADDYPGKWYGWHCPHVKQSDMPGLFRGDAFPDQVVLNSWGYRANDVDEIKGLLPEPFYNMVKHPEIWGAIRINETAYISNDEWPGKHISIRKKATEFYRGGPYIDEKGHIQNYKAGIPFPESKNGIEIAWNLVTARNFGEKVWCIFTTAVTNKRGHTNFAVVENSYFWFSGLLYGENGPLYVPNPNRYDSFNAVGYNAPYDLKGSIPLTHRYDDPEKPDDMWLYIPCLRKVRRLSTTQRWDKLPGGFDFTYDSILCFQGKPTNYEWRYLGRKILLCGHNSAYRLQQIKGKPGGFPDQQYQRVNTVVLEYRPKIFCPISKAVLYLDPDSYFPYYAEFYDKNAMLSRFDGNIWSVDTSGLIHPGSMLVTDVLSVHSTSNYIYDTRNNLDAKNICPSFFAMNYLKGYFGGR
ncbi:conserved hypothetical protein [uncultured Desulfobacterium sp.]|uniref:DUF1329 domain-containing protein n=1 Tax=uncultured Desulfobacterium sp. TaxID=201089 RepID=A0A445MU01_9BACT|nr:conserved hypothetical protein [uncultured Desulfobacterium sp.]